MQMIQNAFKWRDDIKKKKHNEMCEQSIMLFMYIIFIIQLNYIYNNFDKNKKRLEINLRNNECDNSKYKTTT